MRILVVGAGATGGYYGGRLLQAGRDVTFLLRERRAAQITADGLRIMSPGGNVVLHPRTVSAADLRADPQPADLVVLSTKAYSLESALEDAAPAIGPKTLVLPILNGLRHLEVLAARFGPDRLLAGTVRIIADFSPEGVIELLAPLTDLTIGFLPEAGPAARERLQQVTAALTVPGIDLHVAGDVLLAMWRKWWLLASLNTVCILAGGTVGEAVSAPSGESFAQAVLQECMAVAAANGYPPDADTVAEMRRRFADRSTAISSSMFRDMSRGLPVEADHILGDLIARARGVPVPLLTAAYVRLKVYEARSSGNSGS